MTSDLHVQVDITDESNASLTLVVYNNSLSARILHRAPPRLQVDQNSENCCGSENAMPPKIFWDMEGHRGHFRSKNVFFSKKTYCEKNS